MADMTKQELQELRNLAKAFPTVTLPADVLLRLVNALEKENAVRYLQNQTDDYLSSEGETIEYT